MQLHPTLATVTRPVFWDRMGTLYVLADCPECRGYGEIDYSPINPSERDYSCRCERCDGEGKVHVQTDEDELATEEN